METLLNDIRYGVRMLRKSPGFTAIAVIALALGIASTTAIFSVVDVVLLHPLPYPESNRIMLVGQGTRGSGVSGEVISPANYLDVVARNHVFSQMAVARGWQGNLTGGDRPERIRASMTSASFFSLFGVPPLLGRTLLPDDERPGSDHVVVLGYGLWKRRFGADRSLVGQAITFNGEPYTVVGVMPPTFSPDDYAELWHPSPYGGVPSHPLTPDKDPRPFRDNDYLDCWGRLKPGVTAAQASADVDAIALQLGKEYPNEDGDLGLNLVGLQEDRVSDIRPILLVLLAAVGFVLLIGCANVANLLLARATARAKEVSIRAALGANRARLVRQLLTESVLLASIGGLLGIVVAIWAVPALLSMSPPDIRSFTQIGVNLDVLAFSLAASLLSGILFGLAPALHASRVDLNDELKEGERGSTGARGRTRSALVVAEVSLSLTLLIGSGLLVKSFLRLMEVDPGFDANHLLVFNVGLPSTASPDQQNNFYKEVVNRLAAIPGVESAGAVSRLPLAGGNSTRSFSLPGSKTDYDADIRVSTPSYFQTMHIPLLRGRGLKEQDIAGAPIVAVVNQALADRVFPGQDPVGRYIENFGPTMDKIQIVGVVGNVHHVGLSAAPRSEVYLTFGQSHWPQVFMVVRSKTSDPLTLTSAAQSAVWGVNRDVPLANIRTMQDVIANSVLRRKFAMQLLTMFAGLAMLLAAIGLYGVMSYTVSQRTHEIGIRMALGAGKPDVLKLIVGQGMGLVAAGVVIGLVASIILTRLMSGLLFSVSARDPLVFGTFAALLALVALVANYVPAHRATKVDPMVALRYE